MTMREDGGDSGKGICGVGWGGVGCGGVGSSAVGWVGVVVEVGEGRKKQWAMDEEGGNFR